MDYEKRISEISNECNTILGQLSQPLSRLNFLQGQLQILAEMRDLDDKNKVESSVLNTEVGKNTN